MIRKMGDLKRNLGLPVLSNVERIAVTNVEMAEMLAEVFVKVHSNNNISEDMKMNRVQSRKEHPNIMVGKRLSSDPIEVELYCMN